MSTLNIDEIVEKVMGGEKVEFVAKSKELGPLQDIRIELSKLAPEIDSMALISEDKPNESGWKISCEVELKRDASFVKAGLERVLGLCNNLTT